MIDFLMISTRSTKRGTVEIYPKFIIPSRNKSSDLMIRGGDFYAVWLEEEGFWSTDEGDVVRLVDQELDKYAEENASKFDASVKVLHMWDAESGIIDKWHKYCQKQMRDSFHMLDEKLIFSNTNVTKRDYASKRLNYPIEDIETPAYDRLMSVLYSPEERRKIEWAIGSVVEGDSKKIQKFLVLYGAAGTGKSTVLNIIQQLFDGYYSVFDAKSLGSSNNSFALEAFRTNPLVAIQHDGDLSKIEDNTRLNSLVSHEIMTVNEKFKSTYANRFKCFLFMGTNKPVKITDGKSGLLRRLIDVSPTGEKIPAREYRQLVKQIEFELGGIASHCKKVYLEEPDRYDDYIPLAMMGASNDFFNFVEDSYPVFKKDDLVTIGSAWEMYKTFCDFAKVAFPMSYRAFKEELKNYFREYHDRYISEDGTRLRNVYVGFKKEKIYGEEKPKRESENLPWLDFQKRESIFDADCKDCLAQYASKSETPKSKWADVTDTLKDLDTSKLHYVRVPEKHIVIDFDIPGEDGSKSFEKNFEAASQWPKTYAELSKSGKGIHLHYIYKGDPSKLARLYADHVEVKVFTGNSSLRRKLTKCNDIPIAQITSGLPMKGEKKVVNFNTVKSEKGLRELIKRNLNKEIHPGTKPSIDFIAKILEDAYNDGLHYDVSNMHNALIAFAASSSNHAEYCLKVVSKMKFQSDDAATAIEDSKAKIAFYDVEVFPNLFLVNWKFKGKNARVNRMINPKPSDVEELMRYNLIGFNCRRYDNHILYGRLVGCTNEQLYELSQKIVSGKGGYFKEAYNVSYTDVYDFAAKKQSLKKWEIELGIHHQELGLPWDQPVPEEMWERVAEYCDNDVIATEAVFDHLSGDFSARQILADLASGTVNDTTNTLTTKIIFGSNRAPQNQFNYRFMGEEPTGEYLTHPASPEGVDQTYTIFNQIYQPIFPGYTFDHGKSIYRGEEVGEGGYVYAEPGIYYNVAILDVASMHPSSVVAEELFGKEYTKRFNDILKARIAFKREDWKSAEKLLDGKLKPYVEKCKNGDISSKDVAQALKIAINSVYGLTAATFDNPFKDPRNIDNIVAKRGALFMINLKHEVQKRGFTVAHIKTDSIKIPNADKDIIKFVMDYGKLYGYTFEHEATYERMCLVNDAVFVAKYKDGDWTATGAQFQVPYIFKTLFTKESTVFDDFCETKSVSKGDIYIDMNEGLPEDEHRYVFVGRVGRFTPIKEGCDGGLLYRHADDKYYAVAGTKGYRWLESEMVKELHKEDAIDESYYISLANGAVETIQKFGDFDKFVNGVKEPTDDFMNPPETDKEELPWDEDTQEKEKTQ